MSQPPQRKSSLITTRREDDDDLTTPLLKNASSTASHSFVGNRDIPNTPTGSYSKSPKYNTSRSFPQSHSHYNTFIEQQQQQQYQQRQKQQHTQALLQQQQAHQAPPKRIVGHILPPGQATTHSPHQQQANAAAAAARNKLPMRTTKISQKLKLFPEDEQLFAEPSEEDEESSEELDNDVYNQIAKIPHGKARQEAKLLNKMDRSELNRMTAYCTASAYRMDDLVKFLQSKRKTNGTAPKRFDECLYTPYSFTYPMAPPTSAYNSNSKISATTNNNTTNTTAAATMNTTASTPMTAATSQKIPEMFLFDYGVVVFWGMTLKEEQRVLKLLMPFEEEKLDVDDVETEEFHYYYNESYQPRIYNDIITLRHPSNYLIKLTISHAIAQSVKMTLFERLIDDTINETKYIPQVMAEDGNIQMSRTAITKKIGQLFIMRINVNLVSNILDTPEIFWSEPTLEPLYSAIRGYLEISQRVELLNQRVEVISDLLEMLKDHLNSSHGEHLEWIVIWLIGMEILVAVITTSLDAFSLYYNKE